MRVACNELIHTHTHGLNTHAMFSAAIGSGNTLGDMHRSMMAALDCKTGNIKKNKFFEKCNFYFIWINPKAFQERTFK